MEGREAKRVINISDPPSTLNILCISLIAGAVYEMAKFLATFFDTVVSDRASSSMQ
jgi:hypothetical protein